MKIKLEGIFKTYKSTKKTERLADKWERKYLGLLCAFLLSCYKNAHCTEDIKIAFCFIFLDIRAIHQHFTSDALAVIWIKGSSFSASSVCVT